MANTATISQIPKEEVPWPTNKDDYDVQDIIGTVSL